MNELLITGLRESALAHVELTKSNKELHEAAKHYYALLCAEYCRVCEEMEEVSHA